MVLYMSSCVEPFSPAGCREGMYRFLQAMESLNTLWRVGLDAADAAKQPFHLRPKAHVLQHLVMDKLSLWGSPSQCWCYRDEDFVGAVKRLAAKTKHPPTLEKRVYEKLMLLAGLHSRL